MMLRKIDLMHREFGFSPGNKCKTCDNLIVQQANRRYYKCEVYGATDSEASDWRLSYDACGMYNRVYDGNPVIRMVRSWPVPESPLPGQESMFDDRTGQRDSGTPPEGKKNRGSAKSHPL